MHELSREKNKDGLPHYEATIFIGWDAARSQYSCVWLDVFGGVSARSIGTAPRGGDKLPFLFELTAGMRTHTTMSWLPDQTWEWTIDEDEHGKTSRFATLRLHRR